MSASIFTNGSPRTPGEAVDWARAVLRPGLAVVVGIAIQAGGTCANEVAVLETNGRLRVHDRVDRAGGWAFAVLRSMAASRLLLSYNAANVREWLAHDALVGGAGIGDLTDPRHWSCIMRARSAAAGRPDRAYPLGIAPDAVAVARLSLRVIEDLAGGRAAMGSEQCRSGPGRSAGRVGRGGQGDKAWRNEWGRRALTTGRAGFGPATGRSRPGRGPGQGAGPPPGHGPVG